MLHQGNDAIKSLGIDTAAAGALALNMEQDNQGIYYARSDCWQSLAGYNGVYDFFFDIGTEMDHRKFPFSVKVDGQSSSYVLWLWQGDYINLGGGAEMGIYKGNPNWHCTVDTNMTFPMTISVYYITVIYTIDFSSDDDMYGGFKDAWGLDSEGETWTFDDSTHTATFSF